MTREDFMSRVRVVQSGCWLWSGTIDAKGYGRVFWKGRTTARAHRVSYEIHCGKVSKQLDHICRVRHCVNPNHLRPVSTLENLMAPNSKALSKLNAEKRRCPRGHKYSSTVGRGRPRRYCKECGRLRALRKYHEQHPEARHYSKTGVSDAE